MNFWYVLIFFFFSIWKFGIGLLLLVTFPQKSIRSHICSFRHRTDRKVSRCLYTLKLVGRSSRIRGRGPGKDGLLYPVTYIGSASSITKNVRCRYWWKGHRWRSILYTNNQLNQAEVYWIWAELYTHINLKIKHLIFLSISFAAFIFMNIPQ